MFDTKNTTEPMLKQVEQLRAFNKQSWDARVEQEEEYISVSTSGLCFLHVAFVLAQQK